MNRTILFIVSFFLIAACSAHDAYYYRLHPKVLQKAIENCPEQQPADMSCDQLKQAALRVNQLSLELRQDPQAYGKKILALETEIAQQEQAQQHQPSEATGKALARNKKQLQAYLAIVKWLESPEI